MYTIKMYQEPEKNAEQFQRTRFLVSTNLSVLSMAIGHHGERWGDAQVKR